MLDSSFPMARKGSKVICLGCQESRVKEQGSIVSGLRGFFEVAFVRWNSFLINTYIVLVLPLWIP